MTNLKIMEYKQQLLVPLLDGVRVVPLGIPVRISNYKRSLKTSQSWTLVTRVGIITAVRHTTKWQPALGLAEEKLQQQTKTSSAPLYKIKVGTREWC